MIWRVGRVSILVFVFLICLQVDAQSSILNGLVGCQQKVLVDLDKLRQCLLNSIDLKNVTSLLPLLKNIPPECSNLNNVDKCASEFVANLLKNLKEFKASEILGDLTAVLKVVKDCVTKRIQEVGNLNDYC